MGTTLIVSRKFSVRSFWDECIDSKATVFLYIGELARYLLNAFPSDESTASIRKKSQIRLAIGNGLRPDIWRQFKERFNIPEVSEFYASTEGTAGLFNFNNSAVGEGAVGWTGPITRRALVLKIVQFDPITEQPIRDSKGFCVEVKYLI